MGTGITDYLEPPVVAEFASEALELIRVWLAAADDWDFCDWQDLSASTPARAIASEVIPDTPCQVVPIKGSFDEYWSSRSQNLRRNVRRYRDRAEAAGALTFEALDRLDEVLFRELIRLHGERWRQRGESGMIVVNRSAAFLQDIARSFNHSNMLRLFCLRFDGKPAAIIFALEHERRMYNYLSGFDPRLEEFGFGRTLIFEELQYLFARGYEAMDFLRGEETYKSWWGTENVPKVRILIGNKARDTRHTCA